MYFFTESQLELNKYFTILFFSIFTFHVKGQDSANEVNSELKYQGQVSAAGHYNGGNELPLLLSGRYIPQLNYSLFLNNNQLIDFEYSANFYGNAEYDPFSDSDYTGKIKNYRAWARYSTQQLEIRAGLQKINFGSATMLRPLMWFDEVDPRDPLGLTDGVWGILGRYYFLNNANIWLWGLYGNNNPKGWEIIGTTKNKIEFGGRLQIPLNIGEMALSYHQRKADFSEISPEFSNFNEVPDYRIGFDTKLDVVVGLWLEGSWVFKDADLGMYKNQEIINIGTDYTFGVGNGLSATFEQLIMSYDENAFAFDNVTSFSLLNFSWPIGMFDNLSAIIYYNWTDNKAYNYINWQKQFDKITLFAMAYWNPKVYQIPSQSIEQTLFTGKGIQLMFVWNH
jgi:hypothetical protein